MRETTRRWRCDHGWNRCEVRDVRCEMEMDIDVDIDTPLLNSQMVFDVTFEPWIPDF